eukprot:scaffold8061_cov63-Phaeocystis_antarctica.AAC.1
MLKITLALTPAHTGRYSRFSSASSEASQPQAHVPRDEPVLDPAHLLRDAVVADRGQLLGVHRQHAVEVAEGHVGQVAVAHHDERGAVAPKVLSDALEASRLLMPPAQHVHP